MRSSLSAIAAVASAPARSRAARSSSAFASAARILPSMSPMAAPCDRIAASSSRMLASRAATPFS
eukprot:318748-Prymnesium_polylepis.1